MATEELSKRSELRAMQRERERERRRMRDRQRRQSMSLEEREKHLARRRKNYQLRRQRNENAHSAQSDFQPEQTSIALLGEKNTRIEPCAVIPVSDLSVRCDVVAEQGNEKAIVAGPISEGLEATTHKVEMLPKGLRLNHIRHLARSKYNPVGGHIGGNDRIGLGVLMKAKETTNHQLPKRLRLTHIKRLARALKSSTQQAPGQNQPNGTKVEQNLPQNKIQLIHSEMVKSAQPDNINGEDQQTGADVLQEEQG